jgi:membrane dipeptidase
MTRFGSLIASARPMARPLAFALLAALAPAPLAAQAGEDAAMRRARALLKAAPLIDTHNDVPWVIRNATPRPRDVESYDFATRGTFDTDIPKLREGGVGAQFWAVYVPSDRPPLDAMREQLEQIDIALRLVDKYPRDLGLALSVADIRRQESQGRIASLLGIEGGHTIGNSLGTLRAYYRLGVRYMTLTHFHNNDWADAATDSVRHHGLSPFGREVVREMNRLGMLVDISHVSPAAMSAALDVSEAPVIFSHSSARALTDHVRNVPDSILRRMRANGGVVMVNFVTSFVSDSVRRWQAALLPQMLAAGSDSAANRLLQAHIARHGPAPRATVRHLADHVEHIRRVAGVDHLGIGADFYGATGEVNFVQGLEDVSKYPALFAELIRRGWSDADLRKLSRENILRAMGQAERVAQRLQRTRPPSNATIEQLDGKRTAVPTP